MNATYEHPSLTKREHFAAIALAGAMAGWFNPETWRPGLFTHPDEIASDVRDHVDAMMRTLEESAAPQREVQSPAIPSDEQLHDMWHAAGGIFHGNNLEFGDTTASMSEELLLPFLRGLINHSFVPVPIQPAAPIQPMIEPPLNGIDTDDFGDDIPF